MRIFTDRDLTHETTILDLGILEAGEEKEFTFYVLNNTSAKLERLNFTIAHNEVEVIKFPEQLLPNENQELVIKWSPSITLKEGLKARVRVQGKELWS